MPLVFSLIDRHMHLAAGDIRVIRVIREAIIYNYREYKRKLQRWAWNIPVKPLDNPR